MGANFSRVKTWVSTEDVVYSDLNAEFDNILNNLSAAGVDDFSANVSQMQSSVDPGEVGSESLATSVAGEIQRLRHLISEITGEDEWYESPQSSILGLANAIGTGLTDNRLVSGQTRATSAQPLFLVPNGAARTVTVEGATTNFVYYVNGTEYSISTDVNLTNLTAAPSSSNTCLINDAIAADQDWTKFQGENGTEIPIDTAGTEITALIGKFAAFKLDNGSATEYFTAFVKSASSLTKARRGYFFDSSDAPVPRIVYSNNDTITLMKMTWIFAKTDGTLTASYNNPIWSDDEPSSPAIGDYWFDFGANKWKRYDVSAFVDADAVLIGACIQDTSATVGARSFEFFKNYADINGIELVYDSATQVKSRHQGANINVWGSTLKNEQNIHVWDITLDRDTGVSESANTDYYFYLTETGDKVISDKRPYDRREDLYGYYHPHQSWRCVGWARNDGSSNLTNVNSYYTRHESKQLLTAATAAANAEVVDKIIQLDSSGGAFTYYLPAAALWKNYSLSFVKTSSDFNVITIDGFASETINGALTTTVATQYEYLTLYSDGTNIIVRERRIPSSWATYTPTFTGFGTVATQSFFWKRSGDSVAIRGYWITGTSTAVQAKISLPGGVSMDSAKLSASQTAWLGVMIANVNASSTALPATTRGPFAIMYDSDDATVMSFAMSVDLDDPLFVAVTGSVLSSPATANTLDTTNIPIVGWGG